MLPLHNYGLNLVLVADIVQEACEVSKENWLVFLINILIWSGEIVPFGKLSCILQDVFLSWHSSINTIRAPCHCGNSKFHPHFPAPRKRAPPVENYGTCLSSSLLLFQEERRGLAAVSCSGERFWYV